MDTTQANTLILDNSKTSSSRNGKSSVLMIIVSIILYLFFLAFLDEEKTVLPLLSESLVLDNLWETLSACLLELEYTPDHHAVLVLQVKRIYHFRRLLYYRIIISLLIITIIWYKHI